MAEGTCGLPGMRRSGRGAGRDSPPPGSNPRLLFQLRVPGDSRVWRPYQDYFTSHVFIFSELLSARISGQEDCQLT